MKDKQKIPLSIIIITYNEEENLENLLRTLKRQTVYPAEIIVSDANSTDNTLNIAKKYGCIIIEGGKPPVGRNNGAKIALQNRLLFLDSDVIPYPNKFLEYLYQEVIENGYDCATCDNFPRSRKRIYEGIFLTHNLIQRLNQYTNSPVASGTCIYSNKSAFKSVGGFPTDMEYGEDSEFVKLVKEKGFSFGVLEKPKVFVSIRRFESDGVRKTVERAIKYYFKGDKKIKYDFGHHNNDHNNKQK
ncbi:MAG: glycosyltransferase [archaeon]